MTTAREIMTPDAEYLDAESTVLEAARRLAQADVGAMPVCNAEGRLQGMVTDRDLVVKVIAQGIDPKEVNLAQIADQPEVVTIGADDSAEQAIETMKRHAVRRLPVIDGTELVGMVSQADIARALPEVTVGDLVEAISSAPSDS
jgi:CBS domain-containing protein